MLGTGKALFYKILGVKFYELEDVRTSRLAIFDRIASLLVATRDDTDAVSTWSLHSLHAHSVLTSLPRTSGRHTTSTSPSSRSRPS